MNKIDFKKILEDIGLSDEDSSSMLGLFYVGFYKILLESILAVNGNDKKMVSQVGTFLVTMSEQIPEAKKPDFERVVTGEKLKLAIQILNNLKELLPEKNQEKVTDTISQLTKQLQENRNK